MLRRYLLGELAEPEQDEIEMALLSDAEKVAELEDAEDALIEEYIQGRLSDTEKTRFESHFLVSAEHRQNVEAARMLHELMPRAIRERDAARRSGGYMLW